MHPSHFQLDIEPNVFLEGVSEQPGYGAMGDVRGICMTTENLRGTRGLRGRLQFEQTNCTASPLKTLSSTAALVVGQKLRVIFKTLPMSNPRLVRTG